MKLNTQPISKSEQGEPGDVLAVNSIFYTIQGEGPFTGHPAVFIRLSGCNLQCPQCDTEYTTSTQLTVDEVVQYVRQASHNATRLVVITGGEPFRQNIAPLVTALYLDGYYRVQVETNGTLPPPELLQPSTYIVVSPKAGKVNAATEARATAWKYVLNADSYDPEDGLPIRALDHTASPRVARPPLGTNPANVYIQPADRQDVDINGRNLRAAIKSCQRFGYTLQVQLHKIIGME